MVKRRALSLEPLGDRVLPSVTPLQGINPGGPIIFPPSPDTQSTLNGHSHGTYSNDQVESGAGIPYHLNGTAHFGKMGRFNVSGTVSSVGMIVQGHAGGALTFSNEKGSFTLQLQGPEQPGFSSLPQQFSYTISSGTGAYQNLAGQGELTLFIHPQPIGNSPAPHGTFTLQV